MSGKKPKYGYCAVTADPLHIGHIRFIQRASSLCENLTVGVMTDECVEKYKGRRPVMNCSQRVEVISSLSVVKKIVLQNSFDFPNDIISFKKAWEDDFIIIDSEEHKRDHADVILKRFPGISSSMYK